MLAKHALSQLSYAPDSRRRMLNVKDNVVARCDVVT
jgi:hypothetical protein